MVTASMFKTRFPEFNSVEDARIQMFLSDAELSINRAIWNPNKADLAVQYLAAHMLALSPYSQSTGVGGGGKLVQSETVGPLSRTYAVPSTSSANTLDNYFLQTAYGQEYLRLRRSVYTVPIVV